MVPSGPLGAAPSTQRGVPSTLLARAGGSRPTCPALYQMPRQMRSVKSESWKGTPEVGRRGSHVWGNDADGSGGSKAPRPGWKCCANRPMLSVLYLMGWTYILLKEQAEKVTLCGHFLSTNTFISV